MNNRVYFQVIVVSLLLFGGGLSCTKLESRSPGPDTLSANSPATAKSQWMTEDFVEFEGTLEFNGSVSGQKGSLILRKDNPTGLAKFDDFLEIPVNFNQGGHL